MMSSFETRQRHNVMKNWNNVYPSGVISVVAHRKLKSAAHRNGGGENIIERNVGEK